MCCPVSAWRCVSFFPEFEIAVEKQLATLEEFERFIAQPENRDYSFEFINGEIFKKLSTEEHGVIAGLIVTEFIFYLKTNPIGRAGVEVRHRITEDRRNDLIPDVLFISNERALAVTRKGAVPLMPDLVVEIKSPDDSSIAMREKALYYLKNGSRIVWLVFPAKQEVEVYTEDAVQVLNSEQALDGGDVLPGFTLSVSTLFEV